MTRTEIITRLCEMAAELADLSEKVEATDVKFQLRDLEQHFQKAMNEMQDSGN